MKRVPAYIERAVIALADEKRGPELAQQLGIDMPHLTYRAGVTLINETRSEVYTRVPREGEGSDK